MQETKFLFTSWKEKRKKSKQSGLGVGGVFLDTYIEPFLFIALLSNPHKNFPSTVQNKTVSLIKGVHC